MHDATAPNESKLPSLPHTTRIAFRNDRAVPLILQLEPWAYDYTAAPTQQIEIVVRSATPDVWFNLVHNDDGTVQVYVEGEGPTLGVALDVYLDGGRIEIGHNRHLWAQTPRPAV